ncbi:MAG TPA: hybrid sensor histidine kinase/response regulator [Kofleriaceae bacterium]|nr:hybrid sensor histidine kinase/response regulator [Kofleriaceae bacterium]
MLDALQAALSCELVYLRLPGTPPTERAVLRAAEVPGDDVAALAAAIGDEEHSASARAIPGAGTLWCVEAEIPLGAAVGRLVTGRAAAPDAETDRVLVRSAANLVGTTLENARVLEAARRKDEFLAVLGHELRNPLAPIATAVELLERHPAAVRERQVIDRHLRHLSRLVDDLLDISRVTRGHVELRSEYVALTSVLERAAELAAPLIARHRHTLRVADADDITLQGDPVRLAQIFGNLLVNAAKFTPPGGRLEVDIERRLDRVRVTVRDTGRGIARDQLGRIFEPFVQANREHDALSGGLGLGLAIVNDLVARHGGSIAAESDGPGRGAAFTVELPTVTHPIETAVVVDPHAPSVRAGIRVLVVDDNTDVAELLSEALQLEGFQTAVEYDAAAALRRWRSFVPHAGVLDVGLPELDGYELAKKLRAEHGTAPTLIAATGYGQRKDRLRAADAGFDCHFVKPVSVRDLVKVLDQRVVSVASGISLA